MFRRFHESWEIDEVALLVINLTITLGVSVWYKFRKLKRISEIRELERERAEKTARHDPLTVLINRRAFYEITENVSDAGVASEAARFVGLVDLVRF